MTVQINELKEILKDLLHRSYTLHKTGETPEDFKEERETEKEIEIVRALLFQMSEDYRYAKIEEVVKRYRRAFWEYREFGNVSFSELEKRRLAKIEILKELHRKNGVGNRHVSRTNHANYYIETDAINRYLVEQRKSIQGKKNKSYKRRRRYFKQVMAEMNTYAFYYQKAGRLEEVRQMVSRVFGPEKKAMNANFKEIKKVIKLTRMLREQL